MVRLIKFSSGLIFLGVALISCAQTPNDISLSLQPGICVTSVLPNYESAQTAYSKAFPINGSMPATSPYCMAVTMTNNNNGNNANNVQVFQSGLTVTLNNGSSHPLTANLVDYNAAGVPASTFSGYGQVQQVGNIAIFDPKNCVTTIGANVNTLKMGGEKCTFYLQLLAESLPVGTYPVQLSIAYTNGNTSYTKATSFNQRVTLYAGGNLTAPSSNLAVVQSPSLPAESPSVAFPYGPVTNLAHDSFGYVYALTNNQLYMFNGLQWQAISLPAGVTSVANIVNDNNGTIYAATNNGVWAYSSGFNRSGWTLIPNSQGQEYVSVQVQSLGTLNAVYAAYNSGGTAAVQNCTWSLQGSTSGSTPGSPSNCVLSNYFMINTGAINPGTFAIESSPPYLIYATGATTYYEFADVAAAYIESGYSAPGMVSGVTTDINNLTYVGYGATGQNLAVAYDGPLIESTSLMPLVSTNNNTLTGTVSGLYTQSAQNTSQSPMTPGTGLYVYGSNLLSADFGAGISAVPLAYLALGYSNGIGSPFVATSLWQPISGISGTINNVVTVSSLTTY